MRSRYLSARRSTRLSVVRTLRSARCAARMASSVTSISPGLGRACSGRRSQPVRLQDVRSVARGRNLRSWRMSDFSSLPLSEPLRKSIAALDYAAMTPVQEAGLPAILAGRDLIVQAPTGSGKTVAFGLGLLQRLDPTLLRAQALVLCPTRELVDQVAKEIRRL